MKVFPNLIKALSLLLSAISTQAFATAIQFENVAASDQIIYAPTDYYEAGYRLTSYWPSIIASPTAPNVSIYGPTSGTDFFAFCNCSSVTLTRGYGYQPFSLTSFDLGMSSGGSTLDIRLKGTTFGGITKELFFTINDQNWHTILLPFDDPVFSNLIQLDIYGYNGTMTGVALDNINVSEVPIPATAWLFGSGLLGLTATRKKELYTSDL